LKAVMPRAPRGKDDNQFHPDRPLGTFSAKINLAYRLGLLDDKIEHALQLIRKIRNDFAHATTEVGLSQPSHADRVHEIVKCVRHNPSYDQMHESLLTLVTQNSRSTKVSAKRNELVASLAVAFLLVALAIEIAVWKNVPMKAKCLAKVGP
jgi:DNA-binding MltR family transcriptional regulator